MPISYKKFKELIAAEGYHIEEKTQHRSLILDAEGNLVSSFSRKHGKGIKRDEILDCYVSDFKNRIKLRKEHQQ